MPNFCPNCGKDITEKVKFCPECGVDIDSFLVKKDEKSIVEENKTDIKIEDFKIEDKKIERKYTFTNLLVYGVIIVVVIIIFMMGMAFIAGMTGNIQESQTDRNVRIANEIVSNYHKSHTYSSNDLYVCGDMASDVWDMLKAQGINAKLNVGRVDYSVSKISDTNHVWVLAEVAPNQYLALEATGGYSVTNNNNPLYYQGWSFYNPKQLKNYLQLEKQYNDAIFKYNSARDDYNNFVAQYNNANFFTQLIWKGQLDDKKLILNQRIQDLNDINQQISALLSSL
jgi:hypothetical protein